MQTVKKQGLKKCAGVSEKCLQVVTLAALLARGRVAQLKQMHPLEQMQLTFMKEEIAKLFINYLNKRGLPIPLHARSKVHIS